MITYIFLFLVFLTPSHVTCMKKDPETISIGTQTDSYPILRSENKNVSRQLKPKKEWCYILLDIVKEVMADLPELAAGAGVAIGLERLASLALKHASTLNNSPYIDTGQQSLINLWILIPAFITDTLYVINKNIIKGRSTNRDIEKKLHKKLRTSLLALTTVKSQETCLHLTKSMDELINRLLRVPSKASIGILLSSSFIGAGVHALPMIKYPKKLLGQQESFRSRAAHPRTLKNIIALVQLIAMIGIFSTSVSHIGNSTLQGNGTLTNQTTTQPAISFEETTQSTILHCTGLVAGLMTAAGIKITQKSVRFVKKTLYTYGKKTIDCCWSYCSPKKEDESKVEVEEV